ncbi:MAG: hypothetical protein BGO29_02145 [Bacteroidales bacterium 36-12]|nr:MAG: hypothetical protein BGO29_02145 [Bacteroidales bacterium 36-12]
MKLKEKVLDKIIDKFLELSIGKGIGVLVLFGSSLIYGINSLIRKFFNYQIVLTISSVVLIILVISIFIFIITYILKKRKCKSKFVEGTEVTLSDYFPVLVTGKYNCLNNKVHCQWYDFNSCEFKSKWIYQDSLKLHKTN